MSTVNRAEMLNRTLKVLKKYYKPVPPKPERTLLQQLLFAGVLENATPEAAERGYDALMTRFFDLNELRVSTVRELAEVLGDIPDAEEAGKRVKGILQSVFESLYSFDLEPLKKMNQGQAIKSIEKFQGVTSFGLAYVTQTALGGHAVPVSSGTMRSLLAIGIVSEQEAAKNHVPGLERAIPKTKGIECASLLHQLGAALFASPYGPAIRKLLLEIAPDCKDRLPKREVKKPPVQPPEPAETAAKPAKDGKDAKDSDGKAAKKTESAKSDEGKQPAVAKRDARQPAAGKKEPAGKKQAPKKKDARKESPAKRPAAKKKPAEKKKPSAAASRKKAVARSPVKKTTVGKRIVKRKPK